jgi:RNA polymerase sigma-70 factor (ECF subfamily)
MTTEIEEVVQRYQRRVFTFARYFLGQREEAEDVTQEVLIRLWRNADGLDDERLGAWLLRVTRNACYDRLRQRRSAAALVVPDVDPEVAEETAMSAMVASPAPDPAALAESAEFKRHLLAALGRLEEPYRSILILREVEDLKYQEISDALDLPLNTVRVYIHRGRQRLREEWKEGFDDAKKAARIA